MTDTQLRIICYFLYKIWKHGSPHSSTTFRDMYESAEYYAERKI